MHSQNHLLVEEVAVLTGLKSSKGLLPCLLLITRPTQHVHSWPHLRLLKETTRRLEQWESAGSEAYDSLPLPFAFAEAPSFRVFLALNIKRLIS